MTKEEPRHPSLHGPGATPRSADHPSRGYLCVRRDGLRTADRLQAFSGNSAEILKNQLDRSEFINPCDLNADIPPALEKVILRCIEKVPSDRHPVMGVMVRELKAALYV